MQDVESCREYKPRDDEANPHVIEKIVCDPFWWAYRSMLHSFHKVLEGLGQWSEGCPCHEQLWALDEERKRSVRSRCRALGLVDGGILDDQCPLSSLRAAEMAAGDWQIVFSRLFDSGSEELLRNIRITDEQVGILWHEVSKARSAIMDELTNKLAYWKAFPWRLAALAHHNEATARLHAGMMLGEWDGLDHCEAKHHPLTVSVLSSGVRQEIESFRDGARREALPELMLLCSRLRFVPVSERPIEGRFSQVTLASSHRNVSPAYVSLQVRVPQWEERVKRKPSVLQDTMRAFGLARKKRKLPALLGLDRAPLIAQELVDLELGVLRAGKRQCTSRLGVLVSRQMYSNEVSEKFKSVSVARKVNQKKQGQIRRHRVVKGAPPLDVTLRRLRETCATEHFRATAADENVFSLQTVGDGDLVLMGLEEKRSLVATSKAGPSRLSEDAGADFGMEPEALESTTMFFSIVRRSYKRSKLVPVPPAAGAKMGAEDICIARHTCLLGSASQLDTPLVAVQPSLVLASPLAILSRIGEGAAEAPEERFLCWTVRKTLRFAVLGIEASPEIVEFVTKLVSARAMPSYNQPLIVQDSLGDDPESVILMLESAGIIRLVSEDASKTAWEFTHQGVAQLVPLRELRMPRPALSIRPNVDLSDRTPYELLSMLEASGWQWRKMPRRRRGQPALPAYEFPNSEKVFYTKALSLPSAYAQCLLSAEQLKLSGTPQIAHGQSVAHYRGLLRLTDQVEAPCALALDDGPFDDGLEAIRDTRAGDPASERESGASPSSGDSSNRDEDSDADTASLAVASAEVALGTDLDGQGGSKNVVPIPASPASEPLEPVAGAAYEQMEVGNGRDGDAPVDAGVGLAATGSGRAARSRENASEWHPFRITWVAPKLGVAKFGAWQGRCPFHKLNAKTDCTKRVNVLDGEDPQHALGYIKMWLIHAPVCTLKREHAQLRPRSFDLFPAELIEEERKSMPVPPAVIKTDAEIDGEAAQETREDGDGAADPPGEGQRAPSCHLADRSAAISASSSASSSSSSSSSNSSSGSSGSTSSSSSGSA